MYCLWKTQGVTAQPWRADLRLGAVRDGDTLRVVVSAEKPWSGRLVFDRPRHAENLRLPIDWPRINQFSEWFTVEAGRSYPLRTGGDVAKVTTEVPLADGFPVSLGAGATLELTVTTGR